MRAVLSTQSFEVGPARHAWRGRAVRQYVALALDGPLSAQVAFVGIFIAAAASAFALWLGLSPFREKYADDPEGKRSPTLKRDAELVNSLWWDAVFYFVLWIVLGFGATFLLAQGMDLLTVHQGGLLLLFFLLTIPLIAVSESGGTAQRHLKAAWVQPVAKITRTVLRYGFGLFGLLVIYGTLNWSEGTFIELLRTKGGWFFELGYVAAVAAAVWYGFSAIWRAVKKASAAHDEQQAAARKAKRNASANRAQASPKAKRAKARAKTKTRRAERPSASSQSSVAQSNELELLQASVSDLERAHVRALKRMLEALVAIEQPDSWSELTTNWIDGMVAFLRDRTAAPPQWLYATQVSVRYKNKQAELEERTELSATRLMEAWVGLRLSGMSAESKAADEQRAMLESHRAMANFVAVVMRRIDRSPEDALSAYAQDLVKETEGAQPDSEPNVHKLFIDRMRSHRERMLSSGHPDKAAIQELFDDDALERLAVLVAPKMRQTRRDGEPHSTFLSDDRAAITVMTFSGTVADTAEWYSRERGGYQETIDQYLDNDMIRGTGADAFGHVSFGFDGETAWVSLTLLPLNGDTFRTTPIVSADFMR